MGWDGAGWSVARRCALPRAEAERRAYKERRREPREAERREQSGYTDKLPFHKLIFKICCKGTKLFCSEQIFCKKMQYFLFGG